MNGLVAGTRLQIDQADKRNLVRTHKSVENVRSSQFGALRTLYEMISANKESAILRSLRAVPPKFSQFRLDSIRTTCPAPLIFLRFDDDEYYNIRRGEHIVTLRSSVQPPVISTPRKYRYSPQHSVLKNCPKYTHTHTQRRAHTHTRARTRTLSRRAHN